MLVTFGVMSQILTYLMFRKMSAFNTSLAIAAIYPCLIYYASAQAFLVFKMHPLHNTRDYCLSLIFTLVSEVYRDTYLRWHLFAMLFKSSVDFREIWVKIFLWNVQAGACEVGGTLSVVFIVLGEFGWRKIV